MSDLGDYGAEVERCLRAKDREIERLRLDNSQLLIALRAADAMAKVIDYAVANNIIGSRSAIADARLDYGEPRIYRYTPNKPETS